MGTFDGSKEWEDRECRDVLIARVYGRGHCDGRMTLLYIFYWDAYLYPSLALNTGETQQTTTSTMKQISSGYHSTHRHPLVPFSPPNQPLNTHQ